MTRSMIDANKAVFQGIDSFCRQRGVHLRNAGTPRWITSDHSGREFLMHADVLEILALSPRRKVATISWNGNNYLACTGFDAQSCGEDFPEIDIDGGHLTLALAAMQISPTATPDEVRNVIEVSDGASDADYPGHDQHYIASLFPPFRLLHNSEGLPSWNAMFRLALSECEIVSPWMSGELATILKLVSELDQGKIPYKVLCRSVHDVDPSSFFLAEYRCLEALFAFDSASKLAAALPTDVGWEKVAATLEDALGWHPREDGSLTALLSQALESDLRQVAKAINKYPVRDDDVSLSASRNIYWLRNSMVHYRPSQHEVVIEDYDWNVICMHMASIILDIYNCVMARK